MTKKFIECLYLAKQQEKMFFYCKVLKYAQKKELK